MTIDGEDSGRLKRLAVLLATSGHSGVDQVMANLLPGIANRGVQVDLLHIKNHGPHIQPYGNLKVIDLGTSHSYSSIGPVLRYLKRVKPEVLFSDKDRVNRVAILSRVMSGVNTRVVVRTGTTVSLDLASRRPFDRFLTAMSMKYLYRRADKVLLPSEAAVEDFISVTGLPSGHVQAVSSPVATPGLYDMARMPAEHPWLANKETPVIVGIGELSSRKDFPTLIQAFAAVRSIRPVRLVIFGEGKQRASLQNLIQDLGVAGIVQLPGFKPDLYPELARADLYVHSSRQEGAPVALMEAVALGVPCVSTDCPSGPAEILQNGETGSLVQVGDVEGMAEAILKQLDTPQDEAKIRLAAQPFTLEASVRAYMEAFGFAPDS